MAAEIRLVPRFGASGARASRHCRVGTTKAAWVDVLDAATGLPVAGVPATAGYWPPNWVEGDAAPFVTPVESPAGTWAMEIPTEAPGTYTIWFSVAGSDEVLSAVTDIAFDATPTAEPAAAEGSIQWNANLAAARGVSDARTAEIVPGQVQALAPGVAVDAVKAMSAVINDPLPSHTLSNDANTVDRRFSYAGTVPVTIPAGLGDGPLLAIFSNKRGQVVPIAADGVELLFDEDGVNGTLGPTARLIVQRTGTDEYTISGKLGIVANAAKPVIDSQTVYLPSRAPIGEIVALIVPVSQSGPVSIALTGASMALWALLDGQITKTGADAIAAGTYVLTAVATDNLGQVSDPATITIRVVSAPYAPDLNGAVLWFDFASRKNSGYVLDGGVRYFGTLIDRLDSTVILSTTNAPTNPRPTAEIDDVYMQVGGMRSAKSQYVVSSLGRAKLENVPAITVEYCLYLTRLGAVIGLESIYSGSSALLYATITKDNRLTVVTRRLSSDTSHTFTTQVLPLVVGQWATLHLILDAAGKVVTVDYAGVSESATPTWTAGNIVTAPSSMAGGYRNANAGAVIASVAYYPFALTQAQRQARRVEMQALRPSIKDYSVGSYVPVVASASWRLPDTTAVGAEVDFISAVSYSGDVTANTVTNAPGIAAAASGIVTTTAPLTDGSGLATLTAVNPAGSGRAYAPYVIAPDTYNPLVGARPAFAHFKFRDPARRVLATPNAKGWNTTFNTVSSQAGDGMTLTSNTGQPLRSRRANGIECADFTGSLALSADAAFRAKFNAATGFGAEFGVKVGAIGATRYLMRAYVAATSQSRIVFAINSTGALRVISRRLVADTDAWDVWGEQTVAEGDLSYLYFHIDPTTGTLTLQIDDRDDEVLTGTWANGLGAFEAATPTSCLLGYTNSITPDYGLVDFSPHTGAVLSASQRATNRANMAAMYGREWVA